MPREPSRRRRVRLAVRRATEADINLLVAHRVAMFTEMGDRPARAIARHALAYARWLRPRLRSADVVAWVVEHPLGTPVGSGALWFQPGQPRPGFDDLKIPYILSVYTRPDARGLGVATTAVRRAVDLAKELGYARISLHASAMGRGVYERLGFGSTTEMRLWLDPVQRRRDARRRAAEAPRPKGTRR
ncbi:MAG: GNAT family N-acetyltransferase [Thermoplasmata archaeon]|nr:GNAT family N-acetyltransferase [Thermoplasmata archaeon]